MIKTLLQKLWLHICYRFKYEHISGYYRDQKIYSKHPRWWLVQWDKLKERWHKPDMNWATAPAVKVSTASIEVKKKTHFDLCRQSVEVPLTIRELERSGKINTPERVAWAKAMIEKSKTAATIDYQKHGHPNLDSDFKHPQYVRQEE